MPAHQGYPFTNPFADPGEGREPTIRLIRRTVIALYIAGGFVMLGIQLLPDPGFRPGAQPYSFALVAVCFGMALITAAVRRLPDWWYLGAAYVGIVVVTVDIALLEELRPIVLFYIWPAMAGAFFGQAREAIWGFVLAVVSYAFVLLTFFQDEFLLEWFIDVTVSLAVVMAMVFFLKARALRLVSELDRRASTDPLTGIPNRAVFERELERQLERAGEDDDVSCAVISLDLDRFKQVNDTYGHQAGDEVLRVAARIFAARADGRGTLARVGGEEFAIVMPGCDLDAAREVAEDLRRALEHDTASSEPSLTVSIGVAAYPASGDSPSSIMLAADRALYAAKQAGRNRVVAADGTSEQLLRLELAPHERGLRADPGAHAAIRLAEQLDRHRHGSEGRSREVGELAALLAHELGLDEHEATRVQLAGIVRDVGMLGVPDELFAAAHPLTPEEREIVERHVALGAEVLSACGLPEITDWVAAHHERPDGSGYPRGLRGDEIPLVARIIAAAEAFVSLTHGPGVAPLVALGELRDCAGSQFDEGVVAALGRVLDAPAQGHLRAA